MRKETEERIRGWLQYSTGDDITASNVRELFKDWERLRDLAESREALEEMKQEAAESLLNTDGVYE